MVGIRNLFPLRYVKQVAFLQEKHRERIDRYPRARLEVHCEGTTESWPPLFLPEGAAVRKGLMAWLLLGKAMQVTRELEDPETGTKGLYLVVKDARGREQRPVFLAANEADLAEAGDPATAFQLESAVRAGLDGEFLHNGKRGELSLKLDEALLEMQRAIPNSLDKRREAYEDAVASAETYLKQRGD